MYWFKPVKVKMNMQLNEDELQFCQQTEVINFKSGTDRENPISIINIGQVIMESPKISQKMGNLKF